MIEEQEMHREDMSLLPPPLPSLSVAPPLVRAPYGPGGTAEVWRAKPSPSPPWQKTLWKGGFGLSDNSFLTAQLSQRLPTTKAPLSKRPFLHSQEFGAESVRYPTTVCRNCTSYHCHGDKQLKKTIVHFQCIIQIPHLPPQF